MYFDNFFIVPTLGDKGKHANCTQKLAFANPTYVVGTDDTEERTCPQPPQLPPARIKPRTF